MSSILKIISLIVFLSLVFVFNEFESQPQPHELEYWVPQYRAHFIYGINNIRYCGLVKRAIAYETDRNDPNTCSANKSATPELSIDPGDYRRHDPYGPSSSDGPEVRIFPPIPVARGESPYTLLFRSKIPEEDVKKLRLQKIFTNIGFYVGPQDRAPKKNKTLCVVIRGNRTVPIQRDCTASLITLRWILLAAHCRPSEFHTEMKVWGGSILRGLGQERNVTEFFIHPRFSMLTATTTGAAYDIAVGRVNFPFIRKIDADTNRYDLNTVCLPHPNITRYVPWNVTIFGFGRINHPLCPPAPVTTILNKGIVPVREFERYLISNQHIDNASRHCPGDSGGPAVRYVPPNDDTARAVQVGINSARREYFMNMENPRTCTDLEIPFTHYTSVPFHMAWILRTIERNN